MHRVVALGFAALLLGAPAAAQAEAPSKNVVLFGSSSMNDAFGHLLASELGPTGKVVRKGVAAAGFSRPDYRDVFEIADGLPLDNVDLAVVYLGMNDAQAFYLRPAERDRGAARIQFDDASRWNEAYRGRAEQFLDRLCSRGVKKVAVVLPVDVKSPVMQKRLDRIRDAQRKAAEHASCASAIETRGDVGAFGSGKDARRLDDGVHMSAKGASVVWARIKSKLLSLAEG